ncbi:response regulator [Nitrosopumilaceae archaeon]|nr:response regulator [Nitrosopumilaceae archaeon]
MTRMMIVDASKESRLLMKNFLLAHNHNVIAEASDGIEAIEKYNSEKPDLIFLDLAMSKLDGLSVLRKIRFQDHTSKIIVITGNDDIKIFEECTRLGVLAFLTKPFDFTDVLSAISFSNEMTVVK